MPGVLLDDSALYERVAKTEQRLDDLEGWQKSQNGAIHTVARDVKDLATETATALREMGRQSWVQFWALAAVIITFTFSTLGVMFWLFVQHMMNP
jgi:hypothetical protein